MKKQASTRPSTTSQKEQESQQNSAANKVPNSFTASRHKLTVQPANESHKTASKITASATQNSINSILGRNSKPGVPAKESQTPAQSVTNIKHTAALNQSKPQLDQKLSIQSPKNQFIQAANVNPHPATALASGNQSLTYQQQQQQKASFNFNFQKQNEKNAQAASSKSIIAPSTKNSILQHAQLTSQQQQIQEKGYKSFIQMANKKDNSRTANTSPVVKPPPIQANAQPIQLQPSQPSTLIQKAPQHQVAQSQKVSPIRNASPGDKLVIKKSEIKFKNSPKDTDNDSVNEGQKTDLNKNIIEHSPDPQDFLAQSKQLAFDFIRGMLNIGNQKDPKEDENQQKKNKFVKFGSPGPQKTLKKQNINFVLDMKKHGIQKDIDSVKAMRFYLENSPMQSDNSGILDNSQQSPHDLLKQFETSNPAVEIAPLTKDPLQIQTIIQPEQLDTKDGKKASPSNENSYIFPFQRRARSLSPPKDNNLGDNSNNSQGSNESPIGNLQSGTIQNSFKMQNDNQSIVVTKMNQNANQKDQKGHNRTNSGPIIPDRNIENVIKQTSGIFFGVGPHLSRQGEFEEKQQKALEQKILKGREVEDWVQEDAQKANDREKIVTTIPKTQTGFIGDADDVDEIEDGQDDDWMFQTFEKKNRTPAKGSFTKGINDLEQEDFVIPEDNDDEFEDTPSINQLGSENLTNGYTNMLDKWMNNLQ